MSKLYTRRAARRVAKRAASMVSQRTSPATSPSPVARRSCAMRLAFAMFEPSRTSPISTATTPAGCSPASTSLARTTAAFRAEVVRRSGRRGQRRRPRPGHLLDLHPRSPRPVETEGAGLPLHLDPRRSRPQLRGVHRHGAYNGGAGNPNEAYANEVLDKARFWRGRLHGHKTTKRGKR